MVCNTWILNFEQSASHDIMQFMLEVSTFLELVDRDCFEKSDVLFADAVSSAEVIIPNYSSIVADHFGVPRADQNDSGMFRHFGARIVFDEPTLYPIYDAQWVLDPQIKLLVKQFGVVLLNNVYLGLKERNEGQRNIFPHLAFHLDRGPGFDNQYSLFVRDPYDPIQKFPRKSSTLILPYPATFLQAEKEKKEIKGNEARIDLFKEEEIVPLLNQIMVHQPWTAPEGVGELCVFDNRTVYHASYYRKKFDRGYQIGVRYLF